MEKLTKIETKQGQRRTKSHKYDTATVDDNHGGHMHVFSLVFCFDVKRSKMLND